MDSPPRSGRSPQPPATTLAWFNDGLDNLIWPPQSRIDRYLRLPGCTTTGVKLREGRFEVKALYGTAEPIALAEGVTGLTDRWVKWSFNDEAVGPMTTALSLETAGWLDVTKWLLRGFDLSGNSVVEVTESDRERSMAGNTVELTAVHTQSSYWWTLGLEEKGPPEKLDENFQRLSGYFFGRAKLPLILDEKHSYTYPTWIDSISKWL